MKIYINNLGPISSFEFDLSKDLSLIYGENSVGKSYAMTVVYIILKHLLAAHFPVELLPLGGFKGVLKLPQYQLFHLNILALEKKVKKKIENNDFEEIEITSDYERILERIIGMTFLENIEASFNNSFESIEGLSNKLSKEKFTVKVELDDFSFTITGKENKLVLKHLSLHKKACIRILETNNLVEEADKTKILFSIIKNEKNSVVDDIFQQVISFAFRTFLKVSQVAPNIYFLPASRSGLYRGLNSLSPLIAELSQSRTLLGGKMELPNIAEPVSDYFLHLSNIKTQSRNENYTGFVSEIEKKIMGGEIIFKEDTKKIMFSPDNIDLELDLSFTSSMVSEIALIVAFFKYDVINNKAKRFRHYPIRGVPQNNSHLIFIEEPEAHLHPKVQILLMELFANVVNKDTKIIFTTHSNYMFHKLSNLILDKKIEPERVGSYLMKYDEEKGAVLDTVTMKATEEGMVDENFADVSEQLYEERIRIYDKLNEDAD